MSGFDAPSLPASALFIETEECLLVFPSAVEAEDCLKGADVAEGLYPTAYGPRGERFEVVSERGAVRIRAAGTEKRPDELKQQLLRYFEACGDPADEDEALDVLVSRAWAIEHDYWERCGEGRARTGIPPWAYGVLILLAGGLLYLLLS